MQHRQERIPKHKGSSNHYEGDPGEEEDEEEVIEVICHSAETYSYV